ncbi:MAG: hypothetical protein HFI34_07210 [Lachnospiraceae bacterium]|nr:hypothetical protein [Lachnospiraceae bacterium]
MDGQIRNNQIATELVKKYRVQIILFLSVFIVKVLINLLFKSLTSATGNDEIGTIAGAAYFAGLDWSNVVSTILYYGWGFSALMAPAFLLSDNMSVIYQIMLSYNALLMALCVVICYNILKNFFKINSELTCALVSLASCCFYHNIINGNAIINENPLVFLNWLVLYLILIMQRRVEEGKKVKAYTFLLGFLLCYGLTVHTRFIFTWCALLVAIIIYYLLRNKLFVNIPIMMAECGIGYFVVKFLNSIMQDRLWLAYLKDEAIGNSIESIGAIWGNFAKLFSVDGMIAYLKCVVGQFFILATYSGVFLVLFLVIGGIATGKIILTIKARMNKAEPEISRMNASLYTAVIFIAALIIATILFTSVASINSTLVSASQGIGSKWYVYQRYWAAYCAMAIMLTFVYIIKRETVKKEIITTFLMYIIASIGFLGVIAPELVSIRIKSSGAFTIITPLMIRKMLGYFNYLDFLRLFIVGIFICIISIILIKKRRIKSLSVLFMAMFIFVYVCFLIQSDIPAAQNNNLKYQGLKSILDQYDINDEKYKRIYVDENFPSYMLAQFELNRYELILANIDEYCGTESDIQLLLTRELTEEMADQWNLLYSEEQEKYVIYLLIKDGELCNTLQNAGVEIKDLGEMFGIEKLYFSNRLKYSNRIKGEKLKHDVEMSQEIQITEEMLAEDKFAVRLLFWNRENCVYTDKVYITVEQDDVFSQYEITLNNIEDNVPVNVIVDSRQFHAGTANVVLTCPTGGGYRYIMPYVIEDKGEFTNNLYVNNVKQNTQLYVIIYAPLAEIYGTIAEKIQ